MTTWDEVKIGDTVTIQHEGGGQLTGEILVTTEFYARIGGFSFGKENAQIIEHKPGYLDGDIGVCVSPYTGTWVGIYNEQSGRFHENAKSEIGKAVFTPSAGKKITIVGNINDLETA